MAEPRIDFAADLARMEAPSLAGLGRHPEELGVQASEPGLAGAAAWVRVAEVRRRRPRGPVEGNERRRRASSGAPGPSCSTTGRFFECQRWAEKMNGKAKVTVPSGPVAKRMEAAASVMHWATRREPTPSRVMRALTLPAG